MDFSWLSDIFNAILRFIPRPVIVRATHGGIKWVFGSYVREMKPGWRWVWPLVTDYEIIVTARQTNNLSSQAIVTKDQKQAAASIIIIYSIRDVLQAIGAKNWDVNSTVNDIASSAVVAVTSKWTLEEMMQELTGKVERELTHNCRQRLRQFGVYVHRCYFVEFAPCRVIKLLMPGGSPSVPVLPS